MGAPPGVPCSSPMNTHVHAKFRFVWLIAPVFALLFLTACGNGQQPASAPGVSAMAPTTSARSTNTPTVAPPTPTSKRATTATAPAPTSTPVTPTATPDLTATPPPTAVPAPTVAEPVRLRIPALDIAASVQKVGLTPTGEMGIPSNYTDVAWYQGGARPGAPGNAVIDGHLDSKTGPAVFWKLGNLQPGDEIFVTTADGTELRFVVTGSETYPTADAPRYKIFGPAAAPGLNLITCDGTFNRDVRQYDQRLVVYTTLAPPA